MKKRMGPVSMALIFFLFSALSCVSRPPARETVAPETSKLTGPPPEIRMMNERLFSSLLSDENRSDYRIGPDDLLEISVFEDEKLGRTVRVTSQGYINLPLIGAVKAKGLTSSELEREIRDLLASSYIHDPHVSVFIREFHNQRISIIGAVQKPGVYSITGHKTILDILLLAGGLRDDAGRMLLLIRGSASDGTDSKGKERNEEMGPSTYSINLEELLIGGNMGLNFVVKHGDVINVPASGKVYVAGFVQRPGGFLLGKGITLSQAIALAGGLSPKAKASETRVLRFSGKGEDKEVLVFDLDAIYHGEERDPYLRENDIVYVPRSGSKTVLIEMWDVIKGRIPGFPAW